MPETYDGEAFVKDEAAISAYAEDNLLVADDIAARFPFVESSEIPGTVESDRGEQLILEPGTYVTGEDLDPGRYTGMMMDAVGVVIIEDSSGIRILEVSVGVPTPDVTFELKPGYNMIFKSRDSVLELSTVENDMMEPQETGSLMIPAGTHTAGTHIEPGNYLLASESLPLLSASGEHRIYWNVSGKYRDFDPTEGPGPEDTVGVEINAGDTIVSDYYIELFQQ
ncbi:hypothetical protein JCM19029_08830 [Salinicoccus sesuvii]